MRGSCLSTYSRTIIVRQFQFGIGAQPVDIIVDERIRVHAVDGVHQIWPTIKLR